MRHKVIDGVDYNFIYQKGYPADDDNWKPDKNLAAETLKVWRKKTPSRLLELATNNQIMYSSA